MPAICPHCKAVSFNPNDALESYCGRCHRFYDDPSKTEKRRIMQEKRVVNKQEIDALCQRIADEGRLIEAGWLSLRYLTIPADAPQVQIDEMRNAFYGGAQHLFGSIMGILEPGDTEPTEKDLRRMDLINTELDVFIAQYKAKQRGGQ